MLRLRDWHAAKAAGNKVQAQRQRVLQKQSIPSKTPRGRIRRR